MGQKSYLIELSSSENIITKIYFCDLLNDLENELTNDHYVFFIDEFWKNYWLQKCSISEKLIFVKSGENLKDLSQYGYQVIGNFVSQYSDFKGIFVGVGGGSVLDFVGFLAHVFKRGCELWLVPTTILGALDAAHGGKNALNWGKIKNVLGSFHFPKRIFIIKEFLRQNEPNLLTDAWSEALKMAIIHGGVLWNRLNNSDWSFESFWELLPEFMLAKYEIVKKDPKEKQGIRQILNLGHTFGHIFERSMGISHGKAINWGLRVEIDLASYLKILNHPMDVPGLVSRAQLRQILGQYDFNELWELLLADKKKVAQESIWMPLVVAPGEVKLRPVQISLLKKFFQEYYL